MEAALFALVSGDAGLRALQDTRFYPDELPQNAGYPASTYTVVTCDPDYSHDGDTGKTFYRVQIDCWAIEQDGESGPALTLAMFNAYRALLSGNVIDQSGQRLEGLYFENVSRGTEGGKGGSLRVWRRRFDLVFWHKEL